MGLDLTVTAAQLQVDGCFLSWVTFELLARPSKEAGAKIETRVQGSKGHEQLISEARVWPQGSLRDDTRHFDVLNSRSLDLLEVNNLASSLQCIFASDVDP